MSRFEELTQRILHAMNGHDAEAAAATCASDCVVQDPLSPQGLVGRAAIKKDAQDFMRAVPDLHFEFSNLLEKGDIGACEVRITGTNTGPLTTPMGEVPPTHKRIDMRSASYFRLNADGLIVEERRYFDTGALMRQLGMAPEPEKAMSEAP